MKKITSLILFLVLVQFTNAQMLWHEATATITASENQANVNNLFDNDLGSTWSCTGAGNIVFQKPSNDFTYTGYFLYTSSGNLPASWKFYGSNDGTNFVELDAQTGVTLEASKRARFHTSNTTNYEYYKIELFDTAGYANSGGPIELAGFMFETDGKIESFDNLQGAIPDGSTRSTGSFTGDNDILWSFIESRKAYDPDETNYSRIEGLSIMTRGQNAGEVSATIAGGVTRISFDFGNAFDNTNNDEAYFEVYLTEIDSDGSETLVGTTPAVGQTSSAAKGIQTFYIDNLDYRGNVKIRVLSYLKPIVLDNLGYYSNPLTLGVDDIKVANFKAYPNPSKDSWTLNSEKEIIRSVDVYSVLGNRVLTMSPNSKTAQIDASSLTNGIYFAKINSLNGSTTLRLIKK